MVKPRAATGWTRHRWGLWGGIALIALMLIGVVAYEAWMVQQKTTSLLKAPEVVGANKPDGQQPVDTTPVEPNEVSSYRVAADMPRILHIPKLTIEARIRSVGVNANHSIQAPTNIYDAGWYTGSAKPDQAGAVFIDGHASGASREGLFGYLDTLVYDDAISIEKGNGTMLNYKVVAVQTVPLDAIDMSAALVPYQAVRNGLTLMTCSGAWVNGGETLDHRVIVYAKQV